MPGRHLFLEIHVFAKHFTIKRCTLSDNNSCVLQCFEENMWEQIVHKIDPSLKVCQLDGLLFKSDQDLQNHVRMHAQQQQAAQSSMMNSMLMMGMLGGAGMMGMGMMGGLWI